MDKQHKGLAQVATKIEPPFVRNPYNYDANQVSQDTGLKCLDPSLTQQQFAEESDINFIADRYGLTGEMPTVLDLPRHGDFTGIFDFASAQQAVINAKQQFLELPAKLRARFDNDPQKLLAFMDNDNNREEAEFLGLIPKRPEDAPESPKGASQATPRGEPASSTQKQPEEPPAKPQPKGKTDT